MEKGVIKMKMEEYRGPKITIIEDPKPKKRRRPQRPKKVRDFSNTKYVSPVKPNPRELEWFLYRTTGKRYK